MDRDHYYEHRARITNVVDGDTVDAVVRIAPRLSAAPRVRLAGIDAPEKFGGTRAQGIEARTYVAAELLGRDVLIRTYDVDSFGRWLSIVYIDSLNFNQHLVHRGHAIPSEAYPSPEVRP